MATSNQIVARLFILLLFAGGTASCAGDRSSPRTDGGPDVVSDTSTQDVARTDTSTQDVHVADTGSDLPPTDAPVDVVTTDVPPDLGSPDEVTPVDGSTVDQAPTDLPIDSTVADASDPDA
jgi:hypothetical protein